MNIVFWLLVVAVIVFGGISVLMKDYKKPKLRAALFLAYLLCSAVCWYMYFENSSSYGSTILAMLLGIYVGFTALLSK